MSKTPRSLSGKVAVVTGGARGIGQALARALAREGVVVAIGDLDAAAAGAAATELGNGSIGLALDVTDRPGFTAFLDEVERRLGPLDILVNNAGIEKHAPFWDVSESDYDKVVDVNLKGAFFATQAMVRHLRARGRRGRIVNISSVHEELPFPNFAAYCASKGGLRMLTRNLAVELGPFGIAVNNIAPGAIETATSPSPPPKLGSGEPSTSRRITTKSKFVPELVSASPVPAATIRPSACTATSDRSPRIRT